MKILILTNHLQDFAGSEIQVLEVYEYLKQNNHTVKIYANYTGAPIIGCFHNNDVISNINYINLEEFDLVWSQHCVFARLFKNKIYENLNIKLVSVHLSPFELLELGTLSYMVQLNATFLANSEETKQKLLDFSIPENKIIVSNNPAPDAFKQSQTRQILKNVLVVSNHVPEEVYGAAKILNKNQINVDFFGLGNETQKRITPDILNKYDLIVTVGKTVQYALLSQIPVYNYDYFGGCGYLNDENFKKSKYHNFSGRGFDKKTSEEIAEQIQCDFDIGVKFSQEFDGHNDFSLSVFMERLQENLEFSFIGIQQSQLIKRSYPLEESVSHFYEQLKYATEKQKNIQERLECTQQDILSVKQKLFSAEQQIAEKQRLLVKYKNLWVVRLFKPLIKIEQIISSGNRYRKLFWKLIKEKGSVAKAYQVCRHAYETNGIRSIKVLLRQQNIDSREIEALSVENVKDGFVILATKQTQYIAKLFNHALKKVNIESTVILEMPKEGYSNKWHIVICPQMFEIMPERYLAFQMEQSVSSRWFTEKYFQCLRGAAHVFDYSIANIAFLQKNQFPFKQLHYMPVGVLPLPDQNHTDFEYDVAFYGDTNCARRKLFLEKLCEKFSVKVISEVFGDELYDLLKKAKIVVNIHYYENALLETTRIYECLSLNKLVVSEQGSDQHEHTELEGIVDFVRIGDTDAMIERIGYWLDKTEHFNTRLQAISDFQQQPDKFQFYLYRFLLSQDLIDFETFYQLSGAYIKPHGDFWCLSLPESVARRQDFDNDNRYGIWVFPGLRHKIGWVGCGLSYKFMMRMAEDLGMPHVTICEDDVLFNSKFEQRYGHIKKILTDTNESWDVYSGLIADLSEKTEIYPSAIYSEYEKFYGINRLVSTVFNIYNQSAYAKIYSWDENDRLFHNTIDRYIEQHGNIRGVITSPFLVGHKEELFSTLWDKQNTIYNEMINKSQNILDEKIAKLN